MATKTSNDKAKTAEQTKPAETSTDNTTTQPGDQGGATPVTTQTTDKGPDQDAISSAVQDAVAPAIAGVEDNPAIQERARVALGNVGETPAPTMVNGKYVGDKVFDQDKNEWVDNPDAAAARVRPADIFDRIGEAFPHERQRLGIEEIARAAALSTESTDLPEGMPAAKSTASLRTDVSGHGRFTGGGEGVRPIDVGTDGKAQVEPVDTETSKK